MRHCHRSAFRRLVAKTLARQFGEKDRGSNCPFHTRRSGLCGTCGAAMTDANPHATVLSVDGIGAYDDWHRALMMSKFFQVSGWRALLPFVRLRTCHLVEGEFSCSRSWTITSWHCQRRFLRNLLGSECDPCRKIG